MQKLSPNGENNERTREGCGEEVDCTGVDKKRINDYIGVHIKYKGNVQQYRLSNCVVLKAAEGKVQGNYNIAIYEYRHKTRDYDSCFSYRLFMVKRLQVS